MKNVRWWILNIKILRYNNWWYRCIKNIIRYNSYIGNVNYNEWIYIKR